MTFNRIEFLEAIRKNNIKLIKAILCSNKDLNFEIEDNNSDALRLAIEYTHFEIADLLLDYGKPTQKRYHNALESAITFEHFDFFKHLINKFEQIIDIKKEGILFLELSEKYQLIEYMEYLANRGVDVNILKGSRNNNTKIWLSKYSLEKKLKNNNINNSKLKI